METQRILPLHNEVKRYAWGSHTALAELRGLPAPSPEPEAELWMGAHPSAPSIVATDGRSSLLELTEADAEATLGRAVLSKFQGKFPFLLKLLAAAVGLGLWSAGLPAEHQGPWRAFGEELGGLFQAVDDVLDGDGYAAELGPDGARRVAEVGRPTGGNPGWRDVDQVH